MMSSDKMNEAHAKKRRKPDYNISPTDNDWT